MPKGSVISQSPRDGTLFKGDTVTLVLSKGPVLVDVPNVVGQQVDQARQALEAIGFKVTVRKALGKVSSAPCACRTPWKQREGPQGQHHHPDDRLSTPVSALPAPVMQTRLATLLLVGVTAVWGSTFFLIRDLVETVPPANFLTVRFGIAAIVMFALFRRQTLALGRRDLRIGAVLGLLYGSAQVLQTMGLQHTDASVSGFITGTYVVLTPVLGAVLLHEGSCRP